MKESIHRLCLVICYSFVLAFTHAQNWQGFPMTFDWSPRCMYADSSNGLLYIGGNFEKVNGQNAKGIISFDGTNWDTLGSGSHVHPVAQIQKFQNRIYVGGADGLACWDGLQWDTILSQGGVATLGIHDGNLMVGGWYLDFGNGPISLLAKWDGVNWSQVHDVNLILDSTTNLISTFKEYKQELYIGGNIDGLGAMKEIMKWDGSKWTDVGGGMKGGGFAHVNDMEIYKGELYVAGFFMEINGSPGYHIARWNGNKWNSVGDGMYLGQVHDLLVYQDKLYACGAFNSVDGINAKYMAHWDGQNWCSVGSDFSNILLQMTRFQDSLYIVGGFDSIDGDVIPEFAKWIGGNYTDTCLAVSADSELESAFAGVKIFPNPASSHISISDNFRGNFTLYNPLGQTVLEAFVNPGERVELSGLVPGIYSYLLRPLTHSGLQTSPTSKGELGVVFGKLLVE